MANGKPYLIELDELGNPEAGLLTVAEYAKTIPFDPKRIYWVYGTPENTSRGNTANKICKNILICLHGKAQVRVEDLKNNSFYFELTEKNKGLYIPEFHWRRIHMKEDTVLLCLSSEKYDEKDYIRDFREFIQFKRGKKFEYV